MRLGLLLSLLAALFLAPFSARAAGCTPAIAASGAQPVALRPAAADELTLTFLGRSSFLISTPGGVNIVTDYNDLYHPYGLVPDIVTMNHAHPAHFTEHVDPAIKFALRGWDSGKGVPHYDLRYGDARVRNVPTNIRDGAGGTEFGGNSIFVFETAGLCIAHLGHLHHTLTPEHLAALGQVDVLLAPIDGAYTLSHEDMIAVITQIKPALVVPMHYFGPSVLKRFLDHLGDRYPVHILSAPIAGSRASRCRRAPRSWCCRVVELRR